MYEPEPIQFGGKKWAKKHTSVPREQNGLLLREFEAVVLDEPLLPIAKLRVTVTVIGVSIFLPGRVSTPTVHSHSDMKAARKVT
jgi:hypothetical protein